MERLTRVTIIRDKRKLRGYKPGEIGQPFLQEDTWFEACPQCGCFGSLRDHQVTGNDDGTITVSPSLLCYGCSADGCGAHYFIINNEIRWC